MWHECTAACVQGTPLQESSQADLREPGGNGLPSELPELRSNSGTRRAKFAKLLAEQVQPDHEVRGGEDISSF